jgi:hypothetical protein
MDVTYKAVLEFEMPKETYKLNYAVNGERYYHALIQMGDMVAKRVRHDPSVEMLEVWDECREIAKCAGVELY